MLLKLWNLASPPLTEPLRLPFWIPEDAFFTMNFVCLPGGLQGLLAYPSTWSYYFEGERLIMAGCIFLGDKVPPKKFYLEVLSFSPSFTCLKIAE